MTNIKRTSPVTAAQVKKARGKLTQVEAAEASGISRRALQTYESGEVAMSEADFEYFKQQTKIKPEKKMESAYINSKLKQAAQTLQGYAQQLQTLSEDDSVQPEDKVSEAVSAIINLMTNAQLQAMTNALCREIGKARKS